MGCLIVAIVLVLLLGGAMWATVGLIGLLLTLFVAGLIGWAADAVVPGRLPGGWLGAILVGILGGFLGSMLFSALHWSLGPSFFGVHVIPAFVGAVVIALLAELLSGHPRAQRYVR
jgi:uncharacterized membrane protein YeaQ/YmgE (transglycosylase-associated protein family)